MARQCRVFRRRPSSPIRTIPPIHGRDPLPSRTSILRPVHRHARSPPVTVPSVVVDNGRAHEDILYLGHTNIWMLMEVMSKAFVLCKAVHAVHQARSLSYLPLWLHKIMSKSSRSNIVNMCHPSQRKGSRHGIMDTVMERTTAASIRGRPHVGFVFYKFVLSFKLVRPFQLFAKQARRWISWKMSE
jgi:hypothetical protein